MLVQYTSVTHMCHWSTVYTGTHVFTIHICQFTIHYLRLIHAMMQAASDEKIVILGIFTALKLISASPLLEGSLLLIL